MLIFLIYVDDIVLTGIDSQLINHLISTLHSLFAHKDLGDLHFFLGIGAYQT